MKLHVKKIIASFILCVFILASLTLLFLAFKGKTLLINKLEALTHKKVSIDTFSFKFPPTIEVRNLNIEGLIRADYITASPSLLGFLTGKLAFNEIKFLKPQVTFERMPVSSSGAIARENPPSPGKPSVGKILLLVKRVVIKEGRLDFIDYTVRSEGLRIMVKDIDFNLTNAYLFPPSAVSNFELKGNIPWQKDAQEGRIYLKGWIKPFKKDMQAQLKIEDIDGVYLQPYYATWVDLEKARIEKANLNFTSNIRGADNKVVAECHLELTDIVRTPSSPDEENRAERIASAVLGILRALDQGKIVLDFTIRTKMDQPVFGLSNIRMAFENKLAKVREGSRLNAQDILGFPAKFLEGTLKSAKDLTQAMVDGMSAIGEAAQKTVDASSSK